MGIFGAIGNVIDGAIGAIGSLFCRSRNPFDSAISMLSQQFNVVQEMAKAPMQAMIAQVVGGMWVGDGADAFVDTVQNMVTQDIDMIASTITGYSTNLNTANDIIEQADSAITNLIESTVGEVFSFF